MGALGALPACSTMKELEPSILSTRLSHGPSCPRQNLRPREIRPAGSGEDTGRTPCWQPSLPTSPPTLADPMGWGDMGCGKDSSADCSVPGSQVSTVCQFAPRARNQCCGLVCSRGQRSAPWYSRDRGQPGGIQESEVITMGVPGSGVALCSPCPLGARCRGPELHVEFETRSAAGLKYRGCRLAFFPGLRGLSALFCCRDTGQSSLIWVSLCGTGCNLRPTHGLTVCPCLPTCLHPPNGYCSRVGAAKMVERRSGVRVQSLIGGQGLQGAQCVVS